jgi:soluble lytic murein transglycosylase-like protein
MKKILLFLFLLFSSFGFNGSIVTNAENGENNVEKASKMLVDMEREQYIKMYQQIYQQSLIQQIEFESEVIIPNYIDFKYVEYTYDLANQLNISSRMIFRLMFKESSFIDTVTSPRGAKGLMQLMPDTRASYYETLRVDTLNLDKNQEDIYIGTYYLLDLKTYWRGRGNSENYSWKLGLASYNAGKGNVLKYQGIPPYKETQDFVLFILKSHSNPAFYANILNKKKNDGNVS